MADNQSSPTGRFLGYADENVPPGCAAELSILGCLSFSDVAVEEALIQNK